MKEGNKQTNKQTQWKESEWQRYAALKQIKEKNALQKESWRNKTDAEESSTTKKGLLMKRLPIERMNVDSRLNHNTVCDWSFHNVTNASDNHTSEIHVLGRHTHTHTCYILVCCNSSHAKTVNSKLWK